MKIKKCFMRNLLVLVVLFIGIASFPREADAAKKTPYKIKGKTITVSAKKNSDITEALDEALKAARDKASSTKQMTVVVPKGTYKINEKGLHIYSNTTLDLSKGVTLKYSGKKSHPMLVTGINGRYKGSTNYNASSKCKGYKGFQNISIKGGKWVSTKKNTSNTMRLFHATNVTLEGVTFSNGGGVHQLEVAAINGFYVRNCIFKDYGITGKKTTRKLEALQMDVPCSNEVYPSVYEDGTIMKNVEITGCTFSNVPRGVGTHTLLNGAYFTNIKINDNTFTDIAEEAIVGLNYRNCEIKNNKITNCGGGILVQLFKATQESITTTIFDGKKAYKGKILHDANTVISGNDIVTKYSKTCDEVQGIKVYGLNLTSSVKGRDGKKIPKGNYYISGVTVENNTITTAGYGIHMMDTRDSIVRNNTITGGNFSSSDSKKDKYDGILVENFANNTTVTENIIHNMQRNGIFVQQNSSVTSIENNKVSKCSRSGINFNEKSSTTGIINNEIQNCSANGIILTADCNVTNIENNTISLEDSNSGISISDGSSVGRLSKNTITKTSLSGVIDSGIKLTNKAKAEEISDNTIKASNNGQKAAGAGILVYNNSRVTGSIQGNKIGIVERAGISISTQSQVDKDIRGNSVEQGQRGIYILTNSTVSGTITDNVLTNVETDIVIDASSRAVVK